MNCPKCRTPGVKNTALGKEFFYCRTCKDEIVLAARGVLLAGDVPKPSYIPVVGHSVWWKPWAMAGKVVKVHHTERTAELNTGNFEVVADWADLEPQDTILPFRSTHNPGDSRPPQVVPSPSTLSIKTYGIQIPVTIPPGIRIDPDTGLVSANFLPPDPPKTKSAWEQVTGIPFMNVDDALWKAWMDELSTHGYGLGCECDECTEDKA